jgi:hypothetical protein
MRIGAGTDVQHLRNQMQNILDLRRGQSGKIFRLRTVNQSPWNPTEERP